MGQHSLGRLFRKMGGEKKKSGGLEGRTMTRRGCAEGQRNPQAHRPDRPMAKCCTRDEPKFWLSLENGLLRLRSLQFFPDRISQLWKGEKPWESTLRGDRNGKARLCLKFIRQNTSKNVHLHCFFLTQWQSLLYFVLKCACVSYFTPMSHFLFSQSL